MSLLRFNLLRRARQYQAVKLDAGVLVRNALASDPLEDQVGSVPDLPEALDLPLRRTLNRSVQPQRAHQLALLARVLKPKNVA